MTRAMIEHWGRWVAGWRWARDEGDFGGGPVSSWCCARDSITDAGETLTRVSRALAEWRAWLEELAGSFERYPLTRPAAPEDRVVWERGAVDLVHRVVGRTGAGDAWYRHCAQVLTWFLARWGVTGEEARHLVGEAIGSHFHSWIEPAEADVLNVAELLALMFILARDCIVLDEVGPIAQVRRFADDAHGALGLADLVTALIEG